MSEEAKVEAVEVEEKKENRVVVVGTKSWNRTYKACGELYDKVKDVEINKNAGKLTGKLASMITKPIANFINGVKDGYRS